MAVGWGLWMWLGWGSDDDENGEKKIYAIGRRDRIDRLRGERFQCL